MVQIVYTIYCFWCTIYVIRSIIFTSMMNKIYIYVVIAMARAIKFKLRWVVCQCNRIVCNGVTINDSCLYAMLEEDI
jgi:hypothetical protein